MVYVVRNPLYLEAHGYSSMWGVVDGRGVQFHGACQSPRVVTKPACNLWLHKDAGGVQCLQAAVPEDPNPQTLGNLD